MPDIDLTPQQISNNGTEPAYKTSDAASNPRLAATSDANRFGASSNTFVVPNDGKTWLRVENGTDAAKFTFQTIQVIDGNAVADKEVTVAATKEADIGPFRRDVYGDEMKFTIDDVDNVSLAVLRF